MRATSQQKALPHIYAAAASLSDLDYRDILRRHAGVVSMADDRLTSSGFERIMAALETILFARVDQGQVPDPIETGNRWIRSTDYWRRKAAAGQAGLINARQIHVIRALWSKLQDQLPENKRTAWYFGGIVQQATGRAAIRLSQPGQVDSMLSASEAGAVINALRDRLRHAITA